MPKNILLKMRKSEGVKYAWASQTNHQHRITYEKPDTKNPGYRGLFQHDFRQLSG